MSSVRGFSGVLPGAVRGVILVSSKSTEKKVPLSINSCAHE